MSSFPMPSQRAKYVRAHSPLSIQRNNFTILAARCLFGRLCRSLNLYMFQFVRPEQIIHFALYLANAEAKNILVMRKLLGFAKARGEKIKEVSDTTLILPFNMVRAEYLQRKGPVDANRRKLWVDEILLPVFTDPDPIS